MSRDELLIVAGGIVLFAMANMAWNLGWRYFFTEILIESLRKQVNAKKRACRQSRED